VATRRVVGNTAGLKASALRAAERLYRRRVHPSQVVSLELARVVCEISREMGRQLGVMVDRRGQLDQVIVGDSRKLWLPDIGRLRAGRGRLRGIRLIHTHLAREGLTNDDLTDLALLRLDLVGALTMTDDGLPLQLHCAHLLPENPEGQMWRLLPARPVHELELDPIELVRSLEEEFARASRARSPDAAQDQALLIHLHHRQSLRSNEACAEE
jgi:GTP-binding protein HflX